MNDSVIDHGVIFFVIYCFRKEEIETMNIKPHSNMSASRFVFTLGRVSIFG